MKILLISPYWKEDHRWMVSSVKLAELWQRLGHQVVVICMGSETSVEEVSDTLTIHRVKDIFLPDPFNYGIAFKFFSRVKHVVNLENPDLIIVNKILFWSSISLLFLRLSGHKVLLLTDVLLGMTWWPRSRIAKICGAIYAWTLGWLLMILSHRIVFFHPQPEKLLWFLRVAHKSQVIPTGIDPSDYNLASQLHSSGSAVQVTYVGRLESVKGVDDFLAAIDPLIDEHPFLTAQVVGWYKQGHPLVERYGHKVMFTGLRNDIPQVLAQTDIFVLPSYSEGLSNALMEAMSSSCACIATEVGGNRYLIQNGVSGFLFPPGDQAALQAHVRRLLGDPAKRQQMGQAARQRIDEVFAWGKVGKQYQELFDSL